MNQDLLRALTDTPNRAADDVLLEALSLADESEQRHILLALARRATPEGAGNLIRQFNDLSPDLRNLLLDEIGHFHKALRECGRDPDETLRIPTLSLIATSRQGKLAYVLIDALRSGSDALIEAATEALVSLALWASAETRRLQRTPNPDPLDPDRQADHRRLVEQRPEIDAAMVSATDARRGSQSQRLIRAALLLADSASSPILHILATPRHTAYSPLARRLAEVPEPDTLDAFLLSGIVGGMRGQFTLAFGRIEQPPVLESILRRTYWLKDHRLNICMAGVSRAAWLDELSLTDELARRTPDDAANIATWIGRFGAHEDLQDARFRQILSVHADKPQTRLAVLRAALRRQGMSTDLLRHLATDPDPRIARMAAREIVQRRPLDCQQILLPLLASADSSVRQVISRAVGGKTFDQYWDRFDRLEPATRRQAGRALLRLLPDTPRRLSARLLAGNDVQKIKALTVAHESGAAPLMRQAVSAAAVHPNPRIRSKAASLLADMPDASADVVLDRALGDADPRVRANAIEVVEARKLTEYVPLLTQRTTVSDSRERANAIKALSSMNVSLAAPALLTMLKDPRPEHRVSALWAMSKLGIYKALAEVAHLAATDSNIRVRRYAQGVVKTLSPDTASTQTFPPLYPREASA